MKKELMFVRTGLLVAAVLLLSTGFLFAAGQAESPAAEEKVEISIAYPVAVDAPIADLLQKYADEFQAENPNVTITPVFSGGYTDVKTAIQTSIEGGGKAPALAVMLATDLYDLVNAGYVTAMDDLLAAMPDGDAYIEDFLPAFMGNSYYEGKTYSLPFQRSAVVLYYNADLFREEGMDLPTDWDSFAEAAAALTERENGQVTRWGLEYSSDWPYWLFQPLAIGNGKNIVGDETTVYFNAPEVVEALQFYIDLSHVYKAMPEGVQASWGTSTGNFAAGKTAMIMHSSGSMTNLLGSSDFEVGVMGMPGTVKPYASVPGGGNLYITAGLSDAEEQAAFDFAVFLTDPEREAEFSKATGYIVPRYSAAETKTMQDYFAEVPQALDAMKALEYAEKELALQNLGEVRGIFHKYLQSAINGEMSAQEAMDTAQNLADKALEDFR